jgi:hypothetical protein
MLGINHTTTAVIIALTVKEPAIAAPVSLLSHFALDVLPHHGEDHRYERGSANFWPKILIDTFFSLSVILAACLAWPDQAGIIILCAFAAILPDLLWPLAWHTRHHGVLWDFFKFHKKIQHESPAGIWGEIGWLALTILLLINL